MSLVATELEEAWNGLRSALRASSLERVRLRNLRGIRDLEVAFRFPVSVLAGPNGCGKSTLLLACACAYRDPGRGSRQFAPANLFPAFESKEPGSLEDRIDRTQFEFDYREPSGHVSMAWRRNKSWNRSFMGRPGGRQPERGVYFRTLTNLANPSEVRSILQLGRKPFQTQPVTSDLLVFAHRILPQRYRNLSVISAESRADLLFAEIEGGPERRYSELHMSSGERAILRLSKDISGLHGALILIDEVEAGLHPYTQQLAMLELQRVALRQDLQVIVATHSPVVLDSVPPEARIFLDRDEATGEVHQLPAHRDIFQRALYGQSRDQLSILCEDDIAEGVIRGALNVLNLSMELHHEDIVIGRNTGKDQFPSHVRALCKFGKLKDFLLVLDGDSRAMGSIIEEVAEEYGHHVKPLFLLGSANPEQWIWNAIRERPENYAEPFGLPPADTRIKMRECEQVAHGGINSRDAAKIALRALAVALDRKASEIARTVGQVEAKEGRMPEFLAQLRERIGTWRRL